MAKFPTPKLTNFPILCSSSSSFSMADSKQYSILIFLLLFGLVFFTTFTSSGGRNLVQADEKVMKKKSCPVNFETANYTVLTSKCKAPKYPASLCCSAFKDFACPFAKYLNDLTNDCASTMFSYINLYGNYPPGLFATECLGKYEITCPHDHADPPESSK